MPESKLRREPINFIECLSLWDKGLRSDCQVGLNGLDLLLRTNAASRAAPECAMSGPPTRRPPPSGWPTQDLLIEYLKSLRQQIPQGKIILVTGRCSVHRTEASIDKAIELNVRFILMPKGGTGLYQPLDQQIRDHVKPDSRCEFHISVLALWFAMQYQGTCREVGSGGTSHKVLFWRHETSRRIVY
jgi:hypothetical protein